MKKALFFLALIAVFFSCKEEIINKPKKLIEKDIMLDIMYDLSILEAIKYQHLTSVEDYNTNPTAFILRKYKVDSLQFARSNSYYATDYKEYKKMYKIVNDRLEKDKLALDTLIAAENKKQTAIKKVKKKRI